MSIGRRLHVSLASRGALIALWAASACACALWANQTWRTARLETAHHNETLAHAALWPLNIAIADAEARLDAPLSDSVGPLDEIAREASSIDAVLPALRQPLARALAASRDGRSGLSPIVQDGEGWRALLARPIAPFEAGAFRYTAIDGGQLDAYWTELLKKDKGTITVLNQEGEIWRQAGSTALASASLPDIGLNANAAAPQDEAISTRLDAGHGLSIVFEHANSSPWSVWISNLPISLAITGIMLLATLVLAARSLEISRAHRKALARARQSEDRLAAWTRAGADFFWETGVDYKFTQFRNITGATMESTVQAAIGQARWDIAGVENPTTRPDWAEHIADLEARRPFRDFEYYGTFGGEDRWVRVSGIPFFDEDGEFQGYRGVSTSAPAEQSPDYVLRRSQHAVAQSERLLRSVIEQLPASISIKDVDGRILMYNRGFADIAGLAADEGVGRTVTEVIPTSFGQDIAIRDIQTIESKQPSRLEQTIDDAILDLTKFPVLDETGEVMAVVSVGIDITERRTAEQRLANSEQRLAQMVEMLPAGAVYVEDEHLMMNAAAERIIGRSRTELTNLTDWFELVPDALPEDARAIYDKEAAAGFPRPRAFAIRRPDGSARQVEWAGYRSGAREVWLIQDVTERAEAIARFQTLFEESADGHVIIQDGAIVQSNLAAAKLMGGETKDFLIGRTMEEITPERQPNGQSSRELLAELRTILSAQKSTRFEITQTTPGGQEIELEVVATSTTFNGRKAILGEWHDISKRKAYEAQLLRGRAEVERERRLAQERMNDTTRALTGWMWETDAEGRFTFMTDSVERLVGVAPEWHYGKTRADIRAEGRSDSENALDLIDECVAERKPFRSFDYQRLAPDGTVHWMRTSGVPFFSEDGEFRGYRGAAFCIDYEKELEASRDDLAGQAAEARRRLEDAIEAQDNGFALIDAQNRLTACNSAFERLADLIGAKAEIGAPVASRLFDHDRTATPPKPDYSPTTETVVRSLPDGRWLQTQDRPTADGGVVSIWTDVTELIHARQAAEDANVAKSDFLAMISHEIRTPLNAVLGMASVLLQGELPDAQRQQVKTIETSGAALLALINDVLDLSKIEARKIELENKPFKLFDVLDTVLDIAGEKVATQNLRLTAYLDANVPNGLVGDANRLRQILLNLVSNAVKFTHEGDVQVGARLLEPAGSSEQPRLRIDVKDTGIGISATALERLFSPFTQADASTTRRYGGTGLGLSISKRLVELMGGEIGVESAPGEGSHFWIEAPFAIDREVAPEAEAPLLGQEILMVSPPASHVREACRKAMEHRGARVHMADDIAAAMAFLGSRTPETPVDSVVLSSRFGAWAAHAFCAVASDAVRQILITGGREAAAIAAAVRNPKARATFARSWLLVEAVAPRAATPLNAPELDAPAKPDGDALNILLVEDNRVNQMVATAMLRLNGHNIDIAADGLEAIDAVRAKSYDLILMDMQMPRMDGLNATRRIRALGGRHIKTPIIAMTANVMVEDRNRCIEAGMNDFLSKPISHELLAQTIARWSQPDMAPTLRTVVDHTDWPRPPIVRRDEPTAADMPEQIGDGLRRALGQ